MVVGVFLRHDAEDENAVGLKKASNTCVRLEPSAMSPGVASINFDIVIDTPSPSIELFDQLVEPCLSHVLEGKNVVVLTGGCSVSGKSQLMHGTKSCIGIIDQCFQYIFNTITNIISNDQTKLFYIEISCYWATDRPSNPSKTFNFIPVRTYDDALRLYTTHHSKKNELAMAHSIVSCRIQSYTKDVADAVLVGSLVCIDTHANSIVSMPGEASAMEYFSCILGDHLESLVGTSYIPCLLLGLRTHPSSQQQAIQALLYGCRVKDIQEIPAPMARADTVLMQVVKLIQENEHSRWSKSDRSFLKTHLPKVHYSSTSNYGSLIDESIPHLFIKAAKPPTSPQLTTSSSSSGDASSDDEDIQCRVVPAKVHAETLRALAAEKALTERCAARISRLNECIKVQKLAQEKAENDTRIAQSRLNDSEEKLRHVQAVVSQLQHDVAQMKQAKLSHQGRDTAPMNMAQFSARLSKVIEETKQVVAMKDQFIKDLEESHKNEMSTHEKRITELKCQVASHETTKKDYEQQLAESSTRIKSLESISEQLEAKLREQASHATIFIKQQEDEMLLRTKLEEKIERLTIELNGAKDRVEMLTQEKTVTLQSLQVANKNFEQLVARQDAETKEAHMRNHLLLADHTKELERVVSQMNAMTEQLKSERSTHKNLQKSYENLQVQCEELETQVQLGCAVAAAVETLADSKTKLEMRCSLLEQQLATATQELESTKQKLEELTHQGTVQEFVRHDEAATSMIQRMISQVESLRRREVHLMEALAIANNESSMAKGQVDQMQEKLDAMKMEKFLLHAVIDKTEHSLRVLERRHAFVIDVASKKKYVVVP